MEQQSALPALHDAWLGTLTGIHSPKPEPRATCGDCVMCGGLERSGSRVAFAPDVKCCSYVPHLASFLAGRALRGGGASTVRDRIARRAGVTPLGLGLSHADVRHLVGAQHRFGRAEDARCPHFVLETQGCAIWETRNAVCSTWFCKHERGAVSQRFWQAVRDLLIAAEERLSFRCLTESGLPEEQVAAVLEHRAAVRETIRRANDGDPGGPVEGPDDSDEDASPDWHARMWGAWQGREEEWFAGCAELVESMGEDELTSWMDGVRHLIDAVGAGWADLHDDRLPERLSFAPGVGSEAGADVLRLIGYSPFDPLVEPASLLASLRRLDGRPTAEVSDELHRAHAVPLPRDLLAQLHDFGVAVPAQRPPGGVG